MKNPLNPEHSPLNQDPTGRNSMGSKFNPTPAESKDCMNSASYEYRNMSARRGAQFVSMGMPIMCWKIFPANTTKMLSTRNSCILMMSSSVYLLFEWECSFTKLGPSRPKTKYLYLWFPFFVNEGVRIRCVKVRKIEGINVCYMVEIERDVLVLWAEWIKAWWNTEK